MDIIFLPTCLQGCFFPPLEKSLPHPDPSPRKFLYELPDVGTGNEASRHFGTQHFVVGVGRLEGGKGGLSKSDAGNVEVK